MVRFQKLVTCQEEFVKGVQFLQFCTFYQAEISAIKIERYENIEGFACRKINMDVKTIIQHADDLTMALKNIVSSVQANATIENFCKHVGSKVNI